MAKTEVLFSEHHDAPSPGLVSVEAASQVFRLAIVVKEGETGSSAKVLCFPYLTTMSRWGSSACVFKGDGLESSVVAGFEVVCERARYP